jgi:hypothetical protein
MYDPLSFRLTILKSIVPFCTSVNVIPLCFHVNVGAGLLSLWQLRLRLLPSFIVTGLLFGTTLTTVGGSEKRKQLDASLDKIFG